MTIGFRPDDLRKRNRASVISVVRRLGGPSRTEMASATALSQSTISAISADLIAEGILRETKPGDPGTTRRGRPQIALGLDPRAACVVAVSLSLNALTATLIDYAGETVDSRHERPRTQEMTRDALIAHCLAMVSDLLTHRRDHPPVLQVVVAVQGTTDRAGRRMLWSPITREGDVPFAEAIEARFSIPTIVENDCNMMAEALRWQAPDRYRETFLSVLLSDGIGMGLMFQNRLFKGTRSSGGEFGHMVHRPDGALCRCGRRGCIEAYAGNYAILRAAAGLPETAMPPDDIPEGEMRALASRARAADGPEREAFRAAGEAVGFGLGDIFALIDPAPVAFVGIGATAFDLMEPAIRDALERTMGGQGAEIAFDVYEDELALMRQGCAMRALTRLDTEVFAAGLQSARPVEA